MPFPRASVNRDKHFSLYNDYLIDEEKSLAAEWIIKPAESDQEYKCRCM